MMFRFVGTVVSALLIASAAFSADEKKPATGTTSAKPAVTDSSAAKRYPIRSKTDKIVTLETNYGKMVLELYRDVAPAHADSFVARTSAGFYNGTIFHRVIDHFMIQGGDPTGTGGGNAGYTLKAEFNDLPHVEGTLSMARTMEPNSASCQFFICLDKAPHLDHQYTVFGHLLKGYDVLHAIGKVPTEKTANRPLKDVIITKAFLSDAEGNSLAATEPPKEK